MDGFADRKLKLFLNRFTMYDYQLHQRIKTVLAKNNIGSEEEQGLSFYTRLIANTAAIKTLYDSLYGQHINATVLFDELIGTLAKAHKTRSPALQCV